MTKYITSPPDSSPKITGLPTLATPTQHSTFFGAGGVNMLRKSEKHSKSLSPNVRERERETIHEMVEGSLEV